MNNKAYLDHTFCRMCEAWKPQGLRNCPECGNQLRLKPRKRRFKTEVYTY